MSRLPERPKLQRLAERYARREDVSALALSVAQPGHAFAWEADGDRSYFIASITKLFTTSIVMQLRDEGRIELADPIASYLDASIVAGLNHWKGVDRSAQITVGHLLAHTSGIANYFEQKRSDGSSLFSEIIGGADRGWTTEDAIEMAKEMPARFPPGAAGKAFYSDTNFQLLGAIIERCVDATYEEALRKRVLDRLELERTWLFSPATIERYDEVAPMLYGTTPAPIPKAMASFGPDGGIVSTASEQVRFLQAFVDGTLFPASFIAEMTSTWRRVFFPLEYGLGVMRYALPWFLSPFAARPEMIGHSGASGAVLYWVRERDLFVAGTVNQVKKRSLSYQLLSRVVG